MGTDNGAEIAPSYAAYPNNATGHPPPQPPHPRQQVGPNNAGYYQVPQEAPYPYHPSHAYHPSPYNIPAAPPSSSGGIHYSYLVLIALGLATVVQVSKGGLLAYNSNQRVPFAYQAGAPLNQMRNPNAFNGYYGNGAGGVGGNQMPGQQQQAVANNMVPNDQTNSAPVVATQDGTEAPNEPIAAAPAVVEEPVPEAVPEVVEAPVVPETAATGETGTYELAELSNFKDNFDPWEQSDVPIFFHIPKAGGSTVKDIVGTCHRFIMATEAGITDGHDADTEIAVVYPGGGPKGQDRSPFVNVDTTTVAGIARAKQMGFADSGLADAVVTPFIYEADELFTPTAKGRLFTVFRHPIDRAISMFYYLQVADWEPTYDPELKNWDLEQYATSDRIENNWLTRQLTNVLGGELTDENLNLAMEVVRRKFMVGLMTDIETTMGRLERFFHWTFHVNPTNQEKCRETLLSGGSNSNAKNKKEKPQPGSKEYELLAWQNQYDIKLYEYIETLFKEQEQLVADIPDDFRNIDATCCKCDPPTFPPEGFECPKAILF